MVRRNSKIADKGFFYHDIAPSFYVFKLDDDHGSIASLTGCLGFQYKIPTKRKDDAGAVSSPPQDTTIWYGVRQCRRAIEKHCFWLYPRPAKWQCFKLRNSCRTQVSQVIRKTPK